MFCILDTRRGPPPPALGKPLCRALLCGGFPQSWEFPECRLGGMAGAGVAPLDPTTDVGIVRMNVGDTNSTPIVPPVDGQGNYEWMSDAEIRAAITTAGGNLPRAIGMSMLGLARDFAALGRSIKTDDLALDSRQKGKDFLSIATEWLRQADLQDIRDSASFIAIVSPDRTNEPGGRFGDIIFPFRAI